MGRKQLNKKKISRLVEARTNQNYLLLTRKKIICG